MNRVRLIVMDSTDCYYNLAAEEYVLMNRRKGDYLLLWQNDNTIVVGRNQNTPAEINEAYVREHGIHVVRRTTGGGAVYHDKGNLNFSFITDCPGGQRIPMDRFTQPVVAALRRMGVPAEASGRNDILADGKKISGNAQRVLGERILHHGTLLFDSDMSKIQEALKVRPEKLQAKGIQSVRGRVGNIIDFLEKPISVEAFRDQLIWQLAQQLTQQLPEEELVSPSSSSPEEGQLIPSSFSPEEEQAIEALAQDKYRTWEWNFGQSPPCQIHQSVQVPGGILEVRIQLEKSRINQIHFQGDYMALREMEPVQELLRGCPYEREKVGRRLDEIALEDYFGGINREQILDCIFEL